MSSLLSRPRAWLFTLLGAFALAVILYGAAALLSRPAPSHPYFAADKGAIQVIAHRGGTGLRPENTLEAFAHAAALGADILETDLRLTADGSIVCLHDATLERTTDGQGRVEALRLAELQELDAGYRWSQDGGKTFPFRGAGVRVPALEEVFARFPAMRMVVEIKRPPGAALAQPLCALMRRFGMSEKVLVASMSEDALDAFRGACPEVATSLGPREARIFIGASLVNLTTLYRPAGLALQLPYRVGERVVVTADLLQAARGRNLKVHVWTINAEDEMRELIRLGVDGIITDRPDRLIGLRSRAATP